MNLKQVKSKAKFYVFLRRLLQELSQPVKKITYKEVSCFKLKLFYKTVKVVLARVLVNFKSARNKKTLLLMKTSCIYNNFVFSKR